MKSFLNTLFIYNYCEWVWQLTSAGKLMYNYSYPSTDYKWSIAHLKWWIGNLYLSSLFHHHRTHPSSNYSFSWQAETVIFHGDQNSHQPLLLSVPINDQWGIGKSLPGRHNLCRYLYKDFWTCRGWCIYMRFMSGKSFTCEKWTWTAAHTYRDTKRFLFYNRHRQKVNVHSHYY